MKTGKSMRILLVAGALACVSLGAANAGAQSVAGSYSTTWQQLSTLLGSTPTNTVSTSVDNNPTQLPALETLLQQYYSDHSETALAKMNALLQSSFPSQALPAATEVAFADLVKMSQSDPQLALELTNISTFIPSNQQSATTANLWSTVDIQAGPVWDAGISDTVSALGVAPTTASYSVNIIEQSFAPSPPHIAKVVESTTTVGGITGSSLVIPAAKVIFSPTAMDKLNQNDPSVRYFYRLWRYGNPNTNNLSPINPKASTSGSYDLTLIESGSLGGTSLGITLTDPKPETDANGNPINSGNYQFVVPLPNAGLNQYRIDCIRIQGDGSFIDDMIAASPIDLNKLTPWFSGALDKVATVAPANGLGEAFINPAQGFLSAYNAYFEVGELSDIGSVYISGQASGLSQFGRIDLAADPIDNSKIYMSIPSYQLPGMPAQGSGVVFRYDGKNGQIASASYQPGFMTPGQAGLALGKNLNLYTDNSASDGEFGGRLFRLTAFLEPTDTPYAPPYPNPPYPAGTTPVDSLPNRSLVGSVNYYSQLLGSANPVSTQQIVLGKNEGDGVGQQLYVADAATNTIKKVAVQRGELSNWDPSHTVGQPWASTDTSGNTPPAASDQLGFTTTTDMAFSGDYSTLYISQGSYVVRTQGGVNGSSSITTGGTLFTNATGLATCQDAGHEYLFVADGAAGSILRIPVSDIPVSVPTDPQQANLLIQGYTFLTGLNNPGELRVTDDNRGMVFVDNNNLYYQQFGFSGTAVDTQGNPLSGATVTADTTSGSISTKTDASGNFNIVAGTQQSPLTVHINHPSRSYTEQITTTGHCFSTSAGPCVDITLPANGAQLSTSTVTVSGTIFPSSVDFTSSGGNLLVNGTDSYPLTFTGNHNDFTVSGVNLIDGDNTLTVFTNATSGFQAGGSLPTKVTVTGSTIATQAYSGVATDSNYNALPGKTVNISVNGVQAATTTTNGCGYYNATGLPLGSVTTQVVQ